MKLIYTSLTFALVLLFQTSVALAQNVIVDVKKSYPGIKRLEIESGWLEVSYTGGPGTAVDVEAFLQSNDTDQDIVFVTVGDVLKITHAKKQSNYNWNSKNKGYIRINGPEQIALDLKGSSGNISVTKINSDYTSVRVSSGNISISDVKGNLTVRASSGNLNLNGVDGNVTGGLTSGNANMTNIGGNVDYESTSGTIEADGVKGEMNVALTSGNAKLNDIGSLGSLQFTSGNVRATNAGLGENTKFSGTSGNFNVQTTSNLKDFNYSLKASSGNLRVGGISTGKVLEIDNSAPSWIRGNITSGNITIEN